MSGNIKNNKFVIITPFYNPGEFLEKCVSSLVTQRYDNYKIIFIDDMSTDDSWSKLPHDDEKVICIKNTIRKTALENIHDAIMIHCDPDDIVTLVDGDDWLYNKKVLNSLNSFYNEHDCWISYGQASWTDGRRGFATSYTPEEFANVRTMPFKVSHLRTFRAGLYQRMQNQSPGFSHLKDDDGNFYRWSYDTAMMFAIMEMAGHEKTKFNDTILYIYNRDNPISEDRVDQQAQWDVHKAVSQKIPLKQIETYNVV
jgi:glycosyltransferase involved in cell wall biosynthesis